MRVRRFINASTCRHIIDRIGSFLLYCYPASGII
ncbi:hypothetical protein SLEP1_g39436 [Rubroshorea leprosula]|uniref:Uncharacterized protein n=1 Tax=Rubroshorea leprosula TaxID=152421 RepID=A0AAV5L0L3_9ROSI|nr:hypothetical protein SLEP1_g39436 [Rubroshorea leprosula]